MLASVEFLGDPDLDERLPSDTESGCFAIYCGDHPYREIDVHTPVFLPGAPRPSRIQSVAQLSQVVVTVVVKNVVNPAEPARMLVRWAMH